MHPQEIIAKLELYIAQVQEGTIELDDAVVSGFFSEACMTLARKQLSQLPPNDGTFKLRPSQLGRPLCQLHYAKREALDTDNKPTLRSIDFVNKMAIGDMTEAWVLLLMKLAGIPIELPTKECVITIGSHTISGTWDVKVGGDTIYDVKSASPYAYDNKFDSWESLTKGDTFGYVEQGYLYAEAEGCKFGGWIVVNKVSGEIKILSTPFADAAWKRKALTDVRKACDHLEGMDTHTTVSRCFTLEDETWYKKPTGRKKLGFECGYCDYKTQCWGKGNIVHEPNPKSKSDKKYWYYIGE